MNYVSNLVVLFSIYAISSLSLNILLGYNGLFSLCHAALFGIGAYCFALLVTTAGFSFIPALLVAMAAGAICSFGISLPAGRLKGDSFALITLVFQVAVVALLNNLVEITGGPYGIVGIPRPSLFSFSFNEITLLAALFLVIVALVLYASWAIGNSPLGKTMLAIRENELASRTIGKRVFRTRVVACAVAGAVAALGGALYAGYYGYIDPTGFNLGFSFILLAMVVLGGTGNVIGPVVGAALMVAIPEFLRFVDIPSTIAPNIRQIIFGALLVALMFFKPRGLCGRYRL